METFDFQAVVSRTMPCSEPVESWDLGLAPTPKDLERWNSPNLTSIGGWHSVEKLSNLVLGLGSGKKSSPTAESKSLCSSQRHLNSERSGMKSKCVLW